MEALKNESRMEFEARRKVPPVVAVDIPSGWDVGEGNIGGCSYNPQVILSLTAPKKGIRAFTLASQSHKADSSAQASRQPGRHFIGGRFVPDDVDDTFALSIPVYVGDSQIVEVTGFEELSEAEAREGKEDTMDVAA